MKMVDVTYRSSKGLIYDSSGSTVGINDKSNLMFYCGDTKYNTGDSNVSVWAVPFGEIGVEGGVREYDKVNGLFRIPATGLWTIEAKVFIEIGGVNGGINLSPSHLFKGNLQLLTCKGTKWPYYGMKLLAVGQTCLQDDLAENKVRNYYSSEINLKWTGNLDAMEAVQLRLVLHNVVGQIDILGQGRDITLAESDPYIRILTSEALDLGTEPANDAATIQMPLSHVTFIHHGPSLRY